MNYWILKTKRKSNQRFETWIKPGVVSTWETDKPIPEKFSKGDKVAIWRSGSGLYVMATGYVHNRALKDKSDGTHRFAITSTTGVVESDLTINSLRKNILFKNAYFLKPGPSGTIYPLTPEQGEFLMQKMSTIARDNQTQQENLIKAKAVRKSANSIQKYEGRLAAGIARSKSDSSAARKQRLEKAPKVPKSRVATTRVYERNPDVIVEVLNRARGICKCCRKKAPFKRRSDNEPYLEVHHIIPLSENGEDTVENAVALCPNCHRNEHHGKTKLHSK